MVPKLYYFDFNGFAEAIRYILHYKGQKFEDIKYDIMQKWPVKEIQDRLPFGLFPVYEDGDKVLHQSLAIARYVATNTDLLPSDPWEQALVDAAALTVYDCDKPILTCIQTRDPIKKEELRKQIFGGHLDFFFSRFDKQLKENNGHFLKKLSWADFVLVGVIERSNLCLETNLEKNYPHIKALMNEIWNLPGVKEYIRDRKPYAIPFK